MMYLDDQQERLGNVVAKAVTDEDFKSRLIDNPRLVLEEHDVHLPPNVEIEFVANTAEKIYLTLPYIPEEARTHPVDTALTGRTVPQIKNTPKDVGCCGGGSSVNAVWLEDGYDGTYHTKKNVA